MPLQPGCPRCSIPIAQASPGVWSCPDHGPTPALLRPEEASYETFVEVLAAAGDFPTYLPWPMSPGWSVSDFAVVGGAGPSSGAARATLTCCSGTSALDGPVDVLVVSEESGVGLGARCAGTTGVDPGPDVGAGPPPVKIRIGSQAVPLWLVSTSASDTDFDRSVFAGEANGRWLWVILRPASAMLLLRDDWILRDVSGIGPPLVEMLFGGPRPPW
jgi:hypothetical protein